MRLRALLTALALIVFPLGALLYLTSGWTWACILVSALGFGFLGLIVFGVFVLCGALFGDWKEEQ